VDLTNLIASAFLDREGRYAKSEETVDMVRLWYSGASPPEVGELTAAEYRALPVEEREIIIAAPSAAGLVETEGKSNA
jgi:hypothetical protein